MELAHGRSFLTDGYDKSYTMTLAVADADRPGTQFFFFCFLFGHSIQLEDRRILLIAQDLDVLPGHLADPGAEGFDRRFEGIDQRFEAVGNKFDRLQWGMVSGFLSLGGMILALAGLVVAQG